MKRITFYFLIVCFSVSRCLAIGDDRILSYIVDAKKQNLEFYWKDDSDKIIGDFGRLKEWLASDKKQLVFAMNGGMFMKNQSPVGLYIEDGKELTTINNSSGDGNFYLKPNGVFYITNDKKAFVCVTDDFKNSPKIEYATQSGPMLVINNEIHSEFKKGSENLNIRNGVGVLPDGKIVFAISKVPVNFYDFATYFKELGCTNALYLDGAISKIYLPEESQNNLEGKFGVIIAVTK